MTFRVQQIDHVELFVADQYEAARWYAEIFGLEILKDYEYWADGGPLMISSNGGGTMLALFKGEPPGTRSTVGYRRVAFRVDGAGFLEFLSRLDVHRPRTPAEFISCGRYLPATWRSYRR